MNYPHLSRSEIIKLCNEKRVKLNNKYLKKGDTADRDSKINIILTNEQENGEIYANTNINLKILFEDKYIIEVKDLEEEEISPMDSFFCQ